MLIKKLTIAGFRGFNVESVINFHDRLTIISAPNSHGKTSISEALEFLIYGATSKVENAYSRDEYKDSYRNRHYPSDRPAYVEAVLSDTGGQDQNLRIELKPDGVTTNRFVNGKPVTEWPFHAESLKAARPFVLQHALKYLLLVEPVQRFQGFARLLGLNEVDSTFRAIIDLCTKPTASIPQEGQRALNELSTLEARLTAFPELKKVAAALKRNEGTAGGAYKLLEDRADKILETKTESEDRLNRLIEARRAAVAKVYSGDVAPHVLTEAESLKLSLAQKTLTSAVGQQFLDDYGCLCVYRTVTKLQKEANLLNLGVELLGSSPDKCPLCKQSLNDGLRDDICARRDAVDLEIKKCAAREQSHARVKDALTRLRQALRQHEETCDLRTRDLILSAHPQNEPKVAALLGGSETASLAIVQTAAGTAAALRNQLRQAAKEAEDALATCELAMTNNNQSLENADALGKTLQAYLTVAGNFLNQVSQLEPSLAGPGKLFRGAVDALSGTEEISIVIDTIQKRPVVERAIRVRNVLEGLKDLKKNVEQTLAEMMESAMNTDLTAAVMKWYSKIKTLGDPEVHFSGFAMERTKSGDFKSRRLSVRAESYGVELASAVSSLSESKLNALGLCVSVASAIRTPGPWSFLVIDDPIQSWDDEHETQFIDVIRNLVESEGRQVLVFTHKVNWAKQVCEGCRTLNGIHYEITGYSREGPNITHIDWSPLNARLREADTIANDPNATSVRLQQAEEELRIAACQLASKVASEKLRRPTSPHNMNKNDVRAILTEAGVPSNTVDRIQAMFVNADDAHHAPRTYQPNAQRIRQALASLRDAAKAAGVSLS